MPTYPKNPDEWCESIQSDSGVWIPYIDEYTENMQSVDNLAKVAGIASIKTHSKGHIIPDPYGIAQFFLNMDKGLFDGTQKNAKLKFAIFLGTDFTGKVEIIFGDADGNRATKQIELPTGQWLDLGFMFGAENGWIYDTFDWSKIGIITFKCTLKYLLIPPTPFEGDFWIDNMHFEYDLVVTSLRIFSKTLEGKDALYKTATIKNPDGLQSTINLPFGPANISPTGTWSVTILNEDFIKWDDESTDKTRPFTASGMPIAFTVYFEKGEPPPPPVWPYILLGVSTIFIIGYALTKYRGS